MSSPNRPSGSRLTWTPDDLGNFVDQVHDDRFFALWMLIATTGVPLESLAALERDDLDFEERRIHPKPVVLSGGDGRTRSVRRSYGLDPTAYDTLKDHVVAWKKERGVLRQETQRLFVWSNGQQVDAGAVRTMFRQHCSIAGLPVVPLQAMRQAYVVAAIDSGIPVRVLSERLRHNTEPQSVRATPRHDESGVARRQGVDDSRRRGL